MPHSFLTSGQSSSSVLRVSALNEPTVASQIGRICLGTFSFYKTNNMKTSERTEREKGKERDGFNPYPSNLK